MSLLNVGSGQFINTERINYIKAMSSDRVFVMFQTDLFSG